MKVLLVSPIDPDKPRKEHLKYLFGGENTYTRELLSHSPAGVTYVHFHDAIKKGSVAYTVFQTIFSRMMTLKLLPPDAGVIGLKLKSEFDLVHCHGYCLKLSGFKAPVVLSDSSSNYLFLRDYLGWGLKRINRAYSIRCCLSEKFSFYDPNLNIMNAKKLIVWSQFAKNIHEKLGLNKARITVIPPGIAKAGGRKISHKNFHILFAGIWLERKGGLLVLQAFRKLKAKYPDLTMEIIGSLPDGLILPRGVNQRNWVNRKMFLKKILPRADVIVLVPPKAEGYGLVIEEAAGIGIPAIVTNIYALPEIVIDGETGFVIKPQDLTGLVNKLEKLIIDPPLAAKMGERARARFDREFRIDKTNKQLLRVYREALNDF